MFLFCFFHFVCNVCVTAFKQKSPGCYAGAFFMFYSAFCNNVKHRRGGFLDLYLRFQFTG